MPKPYFTMGRRPKKHKTKKSVFKISRPKKVFFLFIFLVILVGYGIFFIADNSILPTIITIANQRSVVEINNIINNGLEYVITSFELTSEDFYNYTLDEYGRIATLSVNTILVNQIASLLALNISYELSTENPITVGVPMGVFTGIGFFAGMGPEFGVDIVPSGEALVEYETSFLSAGINQINFQVWLDVEAHMRIVVPLQEEIITVSRSIALVNTVFAGEIPPNMLLTPFN